MFNHWQTKTIPYSWNPTKTKTDWSGTDTFRNFKKNPEADKWNDIGITYNFSNEGFRTYDFESLIDAKIDVALGCSHTMGVGLPVDWVWPNLVEKSRPYPMLNLGLGAGASDTVARILTNITGLFQIQTVFIFWPDMRRFEIYKDNTVEFIIPNNSQIEHAWNMDDNISRQRLYKNKLVTDLLGHNTVNLTDGNFRKDYQDTDFARDGIHFGPETHKLIAKIFLEKLTSIE